MENLVYLLPALACPVGMGLLMWMMMRGNRAPMGSQQTLAEGAPRSRPSVDGNPDDRLLQLRAQLNEIQAQQAAIAAQIQALSVEDRPTKQAPEGSAIANNRRSQR